MSNRAVPTQVCHLATHPTIVTSLHHMCLIVKVCSASTYLFGYISLSVASVDQADTGHIITGPVITGPVGTGSTRSRQAKQRSVLKEAFKNAWKQGNITSQVS